MEINKNAKIYLDNYYILEQSRKEAHDFLKKIVSDATKIFDDYRGVYINDGIDFDRFVQKDGGLAEYYFGSKKSSLKIPNLDDLKYTIKYMNVIHTDDLPTTGSCKISGFTPKNLLRQTQVLQNYATQLGFFDPYREIIIDLFEASSEVVTRRIADTLIEYYKNFIQLIEKIIEQNPAE